MNVLNDLTMEGNLNFNSRSYIGEVIFSKTLSTMEKVIEVYGGAEWIAIEGRFLLGTSSNYNINTTGGEATHRLTISEMPSHYHAQKVTANAGSGAIRTDYKNEGESRVVDHGVSTSATGGGQAHNNMPPYVSVYIWVRTA